jgi:hypothetical protein
MNAGPAENVAKQRGENVAKLHADADAIEARIKEYAAKEETGF